MEKTKKKTKKRSVVYTYVVDADVKRFVDDNPRHSLLTTRLSQRSVIRNVVISLWNKTLDRNVPHPRLLTCSTNTRYVIRTTDVRARYARTSRLKFMDAFNYFIFFIFKLIIHPELFV